MQNDNAINYTLGQIKVQEKNQSIHDFELGAVDFALKVQRHSLYGAKNEVFTDQKSEVFID